SDNQAYATHQAAMMLPDSAWGTEFVSVPMRASGDRYRIMPSQHATLVMTHYGPSGIGRDTLALDAGEVRDVASIDGQPLNGPVEWHSTAPAMILQLRTGGRYGDPTESPAMLPLVSLKNAKPRSAFVAPEQFAGGFFTTHTLTLIASLPSHHVNDPVGAFRLITLDGQSLETFAPGGSPQRIGSSSYFFARVSVPSGGHMISSSDGISFIGDIGGNNGNIHRDSYLWNLSSWGEPLAIDVTPPYFVSADSKVKGVVSVSVSDRTSEYFSGVGDIVVSSSSAGWTRTAFNVPYPEDDATASFRVIADPSGPLNVTVRDRDGNPKDTVLSESVCFKTATVSANELKIQMPLGTSGTGKIELVANTCGDQADVHNIVFGSGTVALHLTALFDNGVPTIVIPGSGRATLSVTTSKTLPVGEHKTTMRIAINDSIATVAITVVVDPPSSAPDESASVLALRVFPNPVIAGATISVQRSLGANANVTISDNLGRTIRTFAAGAIAGRSTIHWDGRNDNGGPVAAGTYMVTLNDGRDRAVTGVSVVR
ncbi:MAG: T9SS type A sorting domain-containing protein, partial [bacterium]|nr:T9SS type A sorting domain-containing protein [Candidatus Kapabacteria bacterium]